VRSCWPVAAASGWSRRPAGGRVDRIVRSALRLGEETLTLRISARLTPVVTKAVLALVVAGAREDPDGWLQVDLCAGLERRPERTDRNKAVADTSLERLFRREDVPVREKCLWRLLYETAARAQEVLSLNVTDVDLDNKRARTVSKGGDTEWLHFQSGSARLLPRIIAGPQSGPLFLADRRPAPARTPAALDVCPITGRGRLSYERAEYLFKRHSRRISRNGLALHQLRHSALTTLADANVSLPLLMAKSRHKNLRSLQRYVHPSAEAVAAMTAAHDPAARAVSTDKQQDHRGLGLVTAFLPAPRIRRCGRSEPGGDTQLS